MKQSTHVLIITRDDVIRNLLEQICIIQSVQIVISATVQGAETIIDLWGLDAFKLVIIDTTALGGAESEQQDVACHVLATWTEMNPRLPFILLGTLFQKQAAHRIQADRVRFLVKPFRLDDLVDAIGDLNTSLHCSS